MQRRTPRRGWRATGDVPAGRVGRLVRVCLFVGSAAARCIVRAHARGTSVWQGMSRGGSGTFERIDSGGDGPQPMGASSDADRSLPAMRLASIDMPPVALPHRAPPRPRSHTDARARTRNGAHGHRAAGERRKFPRRQCGGCATLQGVRRTTSLPLDEMAGGGNFMEGSTSTRWKPTLDTLSQVRFGEGRRRGPGG